MTVRSGSLPRSDENGRQSPADTLLAVVREFLAASGREVHDPDLDSHLERDLGLDSLGRAELLARLESAFGVRLAERWLEVDTLGELLPALQQAETVPSGASAHERVATPQPAPAGAVPSRATTLVEVLDFHARGQPERTAILLHPDDAGEPVPLRYGELRREARALAAGLLARGLAPGQRVALMLPTGRDYFVSFFGILLAGDVPVPIYPPLRPSQLEEHLRRHARLLANAEAVLLITVPEAHRVARLLAVQVPTLSGVVGADELADTRGVMALPPSDPQATAFVQYSSGSTGDPKGVVLSHANLLANIRAMAERIDVRPGDVFVSWLPLYHDMGLIGACLGSLYQGIPLAVMSPLNFLRRPADWLWAIHRHRGTLSAAPNFAYELCLRQIRDADVEGLDLSSLRFLANGAEPVSAATLGRFAERFAPYGLDPKALAPVYGLAECSVGLTIPCPGRGLHTDRVQRGPFARLGEARPADTGDDTALELVGCGHALAGHDIRIVDERNRELPERRVGRLQFRGPSATRGYLANPEANRTLFQDGWLDSGDRAYRVGSEVFITGRDKDLIIRGGRNLYPYELEQAVGELEGVRKGCVAVFGVTDATGGTERLVVLAETRETEAPRRERIVESIREATIERLGTPPDVIRLVPPQTVLKTSSGKIRRAALRQLFEQDRLEQRRAPVWWQLARLSVADLPARVSRALGRWLERLYGVYAWLVGGVLLVPLWLAAGLLPGIQRRWTAVGGVLRLALRLTGMRLTVSGAEQQPAGACVLVVNHGSYLDALVLTAALKRPVRFVAKHELAGNWWLRRPLERLGVLFVERFDRRRGVAEADRLSEAVRAGSALVFFPEGTFTRAPGLLPFRMGAFVTAARAGVPVVPVILRGTRAALPADIWWPRRAALSVTIDTPIKPTGQDWSAAAGLARDTRQRMLEHTGEPDLTAADSPFG